MTFIVPAPCKLFAKAAGINHNISPVPIFLPLGLFHTITAYSCSLTCSSVKKNIFKSETNTQSPLVWLFWTSLQAMLISRSRAWLKFMSLLLGDIFVKTASKLQGVGWVFPMAMADWLIKEAIVLYSPQILSTSLSTKLTQRGKVKMSHLS